jgi:hypothetical protein
MGLLGTSDPVKKEEKLIEKGESIYGRYTPHSSLTNCLEGKSEEKHLKQALKDVDSAQSNEEKGAKKEHHAQSVCTNPNIYKAFC